MKTPIERSLALHRCIIKVELINSEHMKRLLLISYNFSPELTGIGKYNGEMIEWLARSGYHCSVLTAYPYYPSWKIEDHYRYKKFFYSTEEKTLDGSGIKFKILRCPIYVPRTPSGPKRILLEASFFITALIRLLALIPSAKFDFVMAVSPSFQVGLLGVLYKKLRGAKLLYHVQDLQIEAARNLNMIRSEAVVNTMLRVEKQILEHSDIVSTISEEMVKRVAAKYDRDPFLFPNWTDISFFHPIRDRAALKKEFGFDIDDQIVLYSGAIGEKQGLESLLCAASRFLCSSHVKFVICGTGPYKEKLAEQARERGLNNVLFMPLQPLKSFNRFLNVADIHLVIQKANASDLVMPSKLGAILAVGGQALITANPGSALHELATKYGIGSIINADDNEALAQGIEILLARKHSPLPGNARRYAENFLDIEMIMKRFEQRLLMLTSADRFAPGTPAQISSGSQEVLSRPDCFKPYDYSP